MARTTRVDDGFYSTFVLRPLSAPLTMACVRLGIRPNAITIASLAIGIGAAALMATGRWWGYLAGALALQASLVLDCVDGDVARATGRFSALGGWLDAATDRLKESLVYGGLALGAMTQGSDLWLLAIALMGLQAFRHSCDYTFAATRQRPRTAEGTGSAGGPRHWLRKIAYLPIGERWLILSVGVVIGGPALALWALAIASAVSLAFSTVQRIRRTGPGANDDAAALVVSRQTDHGPLLWAVRLPDRWRGSWALPALERLIEYAVLLLVAWPLDSTARAAAFGWLLAVTFHHYDLLYRALQGAQMPRWIALAGLGIEGRIIVLVAAALALWAFPVLAWGAAWGALLFIVVASAQWIRALRGSGA